MKFYNVPELPKEYPIVEEFTLENFLTFMDEEFNQEWFSRPDADISKVCPVAQFARKFYKFTGVKDGVGLEVIEYEGWTKKTDLPKWAIRVARLTTGSFREVSIEDIKAKAQEPETTLTSEWRA